MLKRTIVVVSLCILSVLLDCEALADGVPRSQNIMDHYRWMEADQDRTNEWLQRRTIQARKTIDAFPWRKAFEKQLNAIVGAEGSLSHIYDAGESRFYLRSTPEFPYQRLFVKRKSGGEKLLIDPPIGMGIHFFSPSHDGRYVAYGLSENGSEIASINILDVESGADLSDSIPRARYPRIVWRSDNQSFFYKRLPSEKHDGLASERLAGEKVYLHHIGQAYKADVVVFDSAMIFGRNANRYDNVAVYSSSDSDWLLASISPSISGYSSSIFAVRADALNGRETPWVKIIDSEENVYNFIFSGKWLYLARYNSSSGYLVTRFSLDEPHISEEKILEWSNGELTGFTTSSEALYVTYHDSGTRRFVRVAFNDIGHVQDVPLPFGGEVTALFSSIEKREVLFTLQSWTNPPKIFRYDPDNGSVENTNLISPKSYDFSDYEVKETWVTSKDQVRVPLTIIHRRGMKLDGSAPTWLSAYGAYGVSTFPYFDPSSLIWLRHGGVIAIAHVRGGGELGPAWHEGGRASNKENSIFDFIKCAEYLVSSNYTKPARLVTSGKSAGGIIIGMAIVQRPELFAAAAIDVGILNTTRLDQTPIGPMNVDEFGSPATEQGMRDLRKIDAYDNLKDGVRYPAVMLTVGLNDNRISPWQSAKFAARLDEIASKVKESNPVLVLAENNAGHSSSTYAQADAKFLDIVSFFLWRTTNGVTKIKE
ncbi:MULTISPECIES: prolyl oligopeptidase family serine peptidase [unclassified Brenneria]|uniref:prolyl oligopeptidase family serine peptidase n=1 Tax=unclassified Brenneria TaxID=2634434 RepID=UPI0029C16BDD|nr:MULTISPECIES: prolyl oligopeptidase family serine peptidase [unclassified Brenneria]MDX5627104.1 prolyl oligopeptidase family serine peptidase [Brenneria sp. L3-3Z]MDX5693546.1 prolyl oligopeptidase family serine peptidase [Brenneria sp. L4-2C]